MKVLINLRRNLTHVSSQTDLQLKLYFCRGEWIMGIETSYLRQAAYALKGAMGSAEEIEKIVINHSLGAAASAVASGWIPGAGGVVASGIGLGFTLSMYCRLCKNSNIPLNKNKLKAVASVAVAEIAAYLAVVIAAETLLTFIPVLGSFGASAIAGICNFAMVYIAGILFLKLMLSFTKKSRDIASMSVEELKSAMKYEANGDFMKDMFKEAKSVYKSAKNDSKYDEKDSGSMD